MQAGRAARNRRRMFRSHPVGKGALKARPHRTEREHARAQHLEDQLLLARANVGLRERDRLAGGAHAPFGYSRYVVDSSCLPCTVAKKMS